NNNDINLKDSLNELYQGNIDVEDLPKDSKMSFKNAEVIILEEDQLFDDFNNVEKYIQNYAKYMGFKLQLFNNENEQFTQNTSFINEQLFYEEIWGLVHIAINKYFLHQDYGFVGLVKTYLASIHEKETRSQQVNNSKNKESNKENTPPNIILRNLKKVAIRG
ncbi:3636_t:CDS:2, partial [Dentiscutata erythropus]